jgi:hypothetical protein
VVRHTNFDRIDIGVAKHVIERGDNPCISHERGALRGLVRIDVAADRDPRPAGILLVRANMRLANQATSN